MGHAGEVLDLAGEGLLVEALHVTLDEDVERALDEHLDEIPDPAAVLVPDLAEGRDGGADGHHPVPGEEMADVPDAADVGVAVLPREPQSLGQVLAHLVAVEDLDVAAPRAQDLADGPREGGLPRARETGEPDGEPRLLRRDGRGIAHGHSTFHRVPFWAASMRIFATSGRVTSAGGSWPARSSSRIFVPETLTGSAPAGFVFSETMPPVGGSNKGFPDWQFAIPRSARGKRLMNSCAS